MFRIVDMVAGVGHAEVHHLLGREAREKHHARVHRAVGMMSTLAGDPAVDRHIDGGHAGPAIVIQSVKIRLVPLEPLGREGEHHAVLGRYVAVHQHAVVGLPPVRVRPQPA